MRGADGGVLTSYLIEECPPVEGIQFQCILIANVFGRLLIFFPCALNELATVKIQANMLYIVCSVTENRKNFIIISSCWALISNGETP